MNITLTSESYDDDEKEHLLNSNNGSDLGMENIYVEEENAKVYGLDEVEQDSETAEEKKDVLSLNDNDEGADDAGEEEEQTEDLTTVFEAFWNICSSIQGLPILAIPYTFKSGGWWSLILLAIVACGSLYSSRLLVKSLYEVHNGIKIRVRSSYMEIGEAFWENGGKWMVLILMVIELIFVSTMYPVLVGEMLKKSFPYSSLPLWAWTIIGGVALFPNASLKNLSQVAWMSMITVICSMIIFVSVVSFSFTKVKTWDISNMNVFEAHEFPAALGILVACYLHQPFAPSIESTMKTPEKYGSALNWSFFTMTGVNMVMGLIAALIFYPNTEESITDNLPVGLFRQIINGIGGVLAFTSYTLPMFTSFDILERSVFHCKPKRFDDSIYRLRVQVLRLGLIMITILMAAFIPRFTYLLAFIGSITGITLEFIFPPLFHLKIYFADLHWWEVVMDVLIVFTGVICMNISLGFSWLSMYGCFVLQKC